MSGLRSKKNKADPHIIALASSGVFDATECIVVCEETIAKRPNRKIPTACLEFGIKSIDIMEMLRIEFQNEEWEYKGMIYLFTNKYNFSHCKNLPVLFRWMFHFCLGYIGRSITDRCKLILVLWVFNKAKLGEKVEYRANSVKDGKVCKFLCHKHAIGFIF